MKHFLNPTNDTYVEVFVVQYFVTVCACLHCAKKASLHQVTTMLATSKNALCPCHNHLLTTGADDVTLWSLPELYFVENDA